MIADDTTSWARDYMHDRISSSLRDLAAESRPATRRRLLLRHASEWASEDAPDPIRRIFFTELAAHPRLARELRARALRELVSGRDGIAWLSALALLVRHPVPAANLLPEMERLAEHVEAGTMEKDVPGEAAKNWKNKTGEERSLNLAGLASLLELFRVEARGRDDDAVFEVLPGSGASGDRLRAAALALVLAARITREHVAATGRSDESLDRVGHIATSARTLLRQWCLEVILHIATTAGHDLAAVAVPLILNLDHEDTVVSTLAARALHRSHSARVADLNMLIMLTIHRDVVIQVAAIRALGRIGPDPAAEPAVTCLRVLLDSRNPLVSLEAARALVDLGPVARPALEEMADLSRERYPRGASIFAHFFGPEGKQTSH